MLTEQFFGKSITSPKHNTKIGFNILKSDILCADDLFYENWHWFIQCAKLRHSDPMHNTKINDFDVKYVILMLTE